MLIQRMSRDFKCAEVKKNQIYASYHPITAKLHMYMLLRHKFKVAGMV